MRDTAGRWWCLECNADTPGGLPEATVWQPLAAAGGMLDPNAQLADRLGAALRRWRPRLPGAGRPCWEAPLRK